MKQNKLMPVAYPKPGEPKFVEVVKTEEKGSDVNLAAHLIHDGYQKHYQVAVLITNDSDLREPVRIVSEELNLTVGVINPFKHRPSRELTQYTSFRGRIGATLLSNCQFPDDLYDAKGRFTKPSTW